jgi:hypothetical protein
VACGRGRTGRRAGAAHADLDHKHVEETSHRRQRLTPLTLRRARRYRRHEP